MSASQAGSQVLELPGGLPSSVFFSAMGVGGVGLVCGWGAGDCAGVEVWVVEREQAESARRALSVRVRKRGIVAFRGAGPEGSMN